MFLGEMLNKGSLIIDGNMSLISAFIHPGLPLTPPHELHKVGRRSVHFMGISYFPYAKVFDSDGLIINPCGKNRPYL